MPPQSLLEQRMGMLNFGNESDIEPTTMKIDLDVRPRHSGDLDLSKATQMWYAFNYFTYVRYTDFMSYYILSSRILTFIPKTRLRKFVREL